MLDEKIAKRQARRHLANEIKTRDEQSVHADLTLVILSLFSFTSVCIAL